MAALFEGFGWGWALKCLYFSADWDPTRKRGKLSYLAFNFTDADSRVLCQPLDIDGSWIFYRSLSDITSECSRKFTGYSPICCKINFNFINKKLWIRITIIVIRDTNKLLKRYLTIIKILKFHKYKNIIVLIFNI